MKSWSSIGSCTRMRRRHRICSLGSAGKHRVLRGCNFELNGDLPCSYRNTFASILVLGSILQELSGEDVNKFERWRGKQQMTDSPQNESLMHTDIERVASEQFPGLTGMMFRRHRDELRKSSMVESVKGKRDRMEGHLGKRSKTMSESSGKGPKETMKNSLKQMRSTTMG